jgi:hypothetical protein
MRRQILFHVLPCILAATCIWAALADDLAPGIEHVEARIPVPARITVRVFNFSSAPKATIELAIAEATRVLNKLQLPMNWVNCSPPVQCTSPEASIDVVVRVLATAFPQASKHALGMTSRSETGSTAAVFYDRALSVRTPRIFPAQILGRAMAHEVVHVLLPMQRHKDRGLMRAQLISDDFRIGSLECSMLSNDLVQMIRQEVARRANVAGITLGSRPIPENRFLVR